MEVSNLVPKPQEATAVLMTNEEARLFILFQKHFKLIETLDIADAFSVKGGFVTINFTNAGEVGTVDVHRRFRVIP